MLKVFKLFLLGSLEATVNGRADAIVSFNHRDFGAVPSQFGIQILLPRDALRSLKT